MKSEIPDITELSISLRRAKEVFNVKLIFYYDLTIERKASFKKL